MRALLSALFGLFLATQAQASNLMLMGYGGPGQFPGGNVSYADLNAFCSALSSATGPSTPTAGGTLTINSQSLGSYDYAIKSGNQTVSSFTNSDWFTTTADSRSAIIAVNGNLTINSGQTFIPSNRKLFTLVCVTGDLAIAGSMSMSARGANHSAGGGNVSAAAIRIATGTFSAVSNPEVPSAGAGGGATQTSNAAGNTGTAGTAGQSGGGGSGASGGGGTNGGAGATGTSFSGGPGGGGANGGSTSGTAGGASGAAGGNSGDNTGSGGTGGAGNPGGTSAASGGSAGSNGTGGVLVIICRGALSGSGTVVAAGANGGDGGTFTRNGGGSGGGSVTIMYGSDTSSITPTAVGGAGGVPGSPGLSGGAGGNGTARKLSF